MAGRRVGAAGVGTRAAGDRAVRLPGARAGRTLPGPVSPPSRDSGQASALLIDAAPVSRETGPTAPPHPPSKSCVVGGSWWCCPAGRIRCPEAAGARFVGPGDRKAGASGAVRCAVVVGADQCVASELGVSTYGGGSWKRACEWDKAPLPGGAVLRQHGTWDVVSGAFWDEKVGAPVSGGVGDRYGRPGHRC